MDLVVDPRGDWVVGVGVEANGADLDVYVGAYSRDTGDEYALQIAGGEEPGGVGFYSDGSFVVGTRGGLFQLELSGGSLAESLVSGAPGEGVVVIDIGTSVPDDEVYALYEDRVDRFDSTSGYLDNEALSLSTTPTELLVVPEPQPSAINPRPWLTGLLRALDKLEITATFRASKEWRLCAKCDDEEVDDAEAHFTKKLKGESEVSAEDAVDLLSVSGSSEAELRQVLDIVALGDH